MKVIDLTMQITPDLPTFPGSPKFHVIPWQKLEKDGYNLELIFMSTHTGTHVDAPYHFYNKGKKLHDIPVTRLVCSCLKINAQGKKTITKEDIASFEKSHGRLPQFSSVLFHTEWSKNLRNSNYFKENPGLSASAARYLVSKKVNLVGIDSPSIDEGTSSSFPAHNILAQNDVLIVENLVKLDKIRNTSFQLAVLPLKLKGATGSPVRAVAIY